MHPMLAPAAGLILGIVLSEYTPAPPAWLRTATLLGPLAPIAVLLTGAAGRRPARTTWHAAAVLLLAGVGVGFWRHRLAVELPADHVAHVTSAEPVLARLAGTIVSAPHFHPPNRRNPYLPYDPPGRTSFILAAEELRNADTPHPLCGLVRVAVEAEPGELAAGVRVQVTGWLYRPIGPRNPGEVDWARWSRLQGIHAGLKVEHPEHVVILDRSAALWRRVTQMVRSRARALLLEPAASATREEVPGLLDAMVLGQRSAAGRAVDEAFLRTGAMHFLSVSGFHVGVLAASGWWLAQRILRRSRHAAAVFTIALLCAYAFVLAEPNAPILRAGIMGVLVCLAELLNRPLAVLNWLALSAVCVLTISPLELFRAGFQLSFLLMLVLLTIVPRVYAGLLRRGEDSDAPRDADSLPALLCRWVWRGAAGLLITCATCWVASLPLTLAHFGRFAPWGALQSAVITLPATITIVMGFFTLLTGLVWPAGGAVLARLVGAVSAGLLTLVDWLAGAPASLVESRAAPAWLVLVTYGILTLAAWIALGQRFGEFHRRVRAISVTGCGAALAALWAGWWFAPAFASAPVLRLHVLAVGNGSATLCVAGSGEALVFDAGTAHNFDAGERTARAAQALGVRRWKAAVLSHANFDHYSGLPTLLERVPAERLWFNAPLEEQAGRVPGVRRFLEALAAARAPEAAVLRAGDRLRLGEATLEVLWPPDDPDAGWRENDRSLVVLVRVAGVRLLLTGDIERAAMHELLARHASGQADLLADVLVAPHHGSVVPGETAALLRAVEPAVIVVSAGGPRPRLEALVRQTLGEEVELISTDSCGAVEVRVNAGGRFEVLTPFAPGVGAGPRAVPGGTAGR